MIKAFELKNILHNTLPVHPPLPFEKKNCNTFTCTVLRVNQGLRRKALTFPTISDWCHFYKCSSFTELVVANLCGLLILWQCFKMGPVEKVILNFKRGYRYSLVIFKDPESVIFASQCLDKIPLYGMEISVRPKGHSEQVSPV